MISVVVTVSRLFLDGKGSLLEVVDPTAIGSRPVTPRCGSRLRSGVLFDAEEYRLSISKALNPSLT